MTHRMRYTCCNGPRNPQPLPCLITCFIWLLAHEQGSSETYLASFAVRVGGD